MPLFDTNIADNNHVPLTLPEIADPIPNPPLRRSSCDHAPPSYLKDYICTTSHPINLTYTNLSQPYHNYILQVSSIYEPIYYHSAFKLVGWCQAMQK